MPSINYKQSKIVTIVSILLILFVIFGTIFLLNPLKKDTALLSEEVKAKESEFSQLEIEYNDLEALSKEAEVTEKGIQDFLKKIPEKLEQDILIENMYRIAQTNDIILSAISFGVSENPLTNVSSVSMSASFVGDYSDLIDFLKGIEENSREIHVKTINVQLLDEKDDIQRINFNLTLESFFQNQEK